MDLFTAVTAMNYDLLQSKELTHTDEGANKERLVITSDFGRDSKEIIKGKTLELITGKKLKQLFHGYGYKVQI